MRHPIRRLAILAAASIASACSSESSTAPAVQQGSSLGQLLGEFAAPGLSAAGSLAGAPGVNPAALASSACPYASASQSFVCPSVSASGLSISQSYVLLSAGGASLSTYDAATVASIRSTSSAAGTISDPTAGTLTVDMRQTMTLSGLLTGAHTLDGSGVTHLTGPATGSLAGTAIDVTNSFAKVVLPPAGAASSYPVSGTVTSTVSSKTGGATLGSTITMTFNGTSKVPVTISTGPTTIHCTIDLASSSPSCG